MQARAKQLFKAGYRNLQTVAKSDPSTLVKEIEHLSKSQAQVLVSSAKVRIPSHVFYVFVSTVILVDLKKDPKNLS